MAWFNKHYHCDNCGERWSDEWSCACNDRCPNCNHEIEPYDYEDLTVIVTEAEPNIFVVSASPPTASDRPDYEDVATFNTRKEADDYAADYEPADA